MSQLILAGAIAFLIGSILGLLGSGGGILAVPLLVYVMGLPAKPAIATSLFFVGVTSSIGAALAARSGRVRWKLGVIFSLASMSGAFVGGRLAHFVHEKVLLAGLGVAMLLTALAMLRGRKEQSAAARKVRIGLMLGLGAAVGLVSGLVGAGGGFLIVPALVLLGRIPLRQAMGTSLFIIALQSSAGFAGHIAHVELDFRLLMTLSGAAVLGMYAGSALSERISVRALGRGFATMVFVTGAFVLVRELPLHLGLSVVLSGLVLGALLLRKTVPRLNHPILEKTCTPSLRIKP